MTKILVIQGANLNWLGIREPEKYGTTTAAELDEQIRQYARERGFEVEVFYGNVEGETINRLYDAYREGVDAVVMNPGGFSYAGHALADCVRGIAGRVPVVEIHITNHFARGVHSVTAAAARSVHMGPGLDVYFLGLDAALRIVRTRAAASG